MMKLRSACAAMSFCCLLAVGLLPVKLYAADEPFDTLRFTANEVKEGGTLVIQPNQGNTGIIHVEGDNVRATIRSVIAGVQMNLLKAGAGDLVLGGVNTYSGDTIIYGGRVLVDQDTALGAAEGRVLLDGGTLRATNTIVTNRSVIIGGNNGGLQVANVATLTLDGQVSGAGALVKGGDGVLVLANSGNTYGGGTQIGSGTVRMTNAGAAGAGGIGISSTGKLELDFNAAGTMRNYVAGSGQVEKTGSGAATVGGAYLQAATLTVSSGELHVANTLEAAKINIATGTTLTAGTLRLANGMNWEMNNAGGFSYNSLEVVGGGNRLNSALPSAAGKRLAFVLTPTLAKGDTMLSVAGNSLDVTGSTLALSASGELNRLATGDTLTLIDKTTGRVDGLDRQHQAVYGATTYTFSVDQQADAAGAVVDTPLTLTYLNSSMTGGRKGPAKAYLESAIAGLHTVAHAGRFVANTGIAEAVKATGGSEAGRTGLAASAAFQAGYQKVDTGSSIKGSHYNVTGGLTYRLDHDYGVTRIGIFAEGGWGDWDTRNRTSRGRVTGDSDIDYAGGGLMLRHDLPNGIYGEGTFRFGQVNNDFSSGDMGRGASYDSDALYWGGHLGVGYIHGFTAEDSLDLFAKVFWTRQEDDDVTTDAGEKLRIKTSDSVVSLLGARYERVLPYDLQLHVGAGWEHEYSGEQEGKLNARSINAPDMSGSSAVGDLGLRYNPQENGFSVDLTGFGSLGVRDSIGGALTFAYEF